MAADEFDPFKLIKKILGKPEESKAAPQPARPAQEPVATAPAIPEEPKTPRQQLLEGLETLPDGQRLARMLELGRIASGTMPERVEATNVILELSRGDFYQRRLALYALKGARDIGGILASLNDSSARLRKLATAMAIEMCTSEQLQQAGAGLQGRLLRRFLVLLRKRGRIDVLDQLLSTLESAGYESFPSLMILGSSAFTAARLNQYADLLDDRDFCVLARTHPGLATEYLLEYAGRVHPSDARFTWLYNSVESILALSDPDKLFEILRIANNTIGLSRFRREGLFSARPNQMVELLIEKQALNDVQDYIAPTLLPKLRTDVLLRVLNLRSFKGSLRWWLEGLSSADRKTVYERANLVWRDSEGRIEPEIVALLPSESRATEARRILKLPVVSGSAIEKLRYASLLPWAEAIKVIEPCLKDSETGTRAQALVQLVKVARYERSQLANVLSILEQRRNEADIVRSAFLVALTDLPPIVWRQAHFSMLDRIIRDTLNATDASAPSLRSIIDLAIKLMHHSTEWACATIALVWKERGRSALNPHWSVRSLEELKGLEVKELDSAMAATIRLWEAEEREQQIISLANLMGKRLSYCPETYRSLESIAKHSASNERAEAAVEILYTNFRDSFEALVPALLELDKTWGNQDTISAYLHRQRQDLLTPFLGQHAHKGRFSTGKVRLLPDFENGFDRWTTAQQAIYARELELLSTRENVDVNDGFYGALRLCLLPEPPVDKLAWLARKENNQIAIRDYVVSRLSLLDNDKGLPLLLECLQDERVRKAVYALRRSITRMNRAEALAVLKKVSVKQITVYKEVIRLAGEVGGEEAYDWLISLARTETHANIKAAVMRALWNYCHNTTEVWDIFDEAATTTELAVATEIARIPVNRLPAESRNRLARVLSVLLQHKDEQIRVSVLHRLQDSPLVDTERVILKPLMSRLSAESSIERRLAAYVFFVHYAPDDEQAAEQVIMSVLKNRHNLIDCLRQLEQAQRSQPARMHMVTRAVLRTLWCDPLTTVFQIRVAFCGLSATDFARFLRSVEHAHRLHYGAVQEAVELCNTSFNRFTPDEMDQIERVMFNKKSDGLRRIGLALLTALGASPSGWTPERVARLKSYRKDTSLLVATVAEFTLPAAETN